MTCCPLCTKVYPLPGGITPGATVRCVADYPLSLPEKLQAELQVLCPDLQPVVEVGTQAKVTKVDIAYVTIEFMMGGAAWTCRQLRGDFVYYWRADA